MRGVGITTKYGKAEKMTAEMFEFRDTWFEGNMTDCITLFYKYL